MEIKDCNAKQGKCAKEKVLTLQGRRVYRAPKQPEESPRVIAAGVQEFSALPAAVEERLAKQSVPEQPEVRV
jgi:hypothetical protein